MKITLKRSGYTADVEAKPMFEGTLRDLKRFHDLAVYHTEQHAQAWASISFEDGGYNSYQHGALVLRKSLSPRTPKYVFCKTIQEE